MLLQTFARRSRKGQQSELALIFALVKYRDPKLLKIFRQDDFRQKSIPARDDLVWRGWVHLWRTSSGTRST